jgi:eukaryotic-like serine/threonine-protein kinase
MTDVSSSLLLRGRISSGTVLNGIYEIDHPLASGGMGEVYKGHTIPGGDPVAIKVMLPDLAQNDAALALFRKEASALHNLHHPVIVRYYVFAIDPDLRRPYLAMEFVEGQSLSELLRHGPLTLEATGRLMQRVATGLQAAHDHGIIHRDVSPDNIIIPLGDVGRARIIDFGIARSTRPGDGTIIDGGFAGKYNYVSPEQVGLFGGEVSGKSDIYSLGLVLIETLTGQAIDMGGSQAAIVEKRRKLPDLGAIDLRIRPLLARMLQPNPADRPDTMADVAEWMLGRAGGVEKSSAGDVGKPVRSRDVDRLRFGRLVPPRPVVGALLGAAVIAGVVVGALLRLQPEELPSEAPAPTLKGGTDLAQALGPGSSFRLRPAAPEAASAEVNSAAAKNPARLEPSVPAASLVPVSDIERYVDEYNGGDCFFAARTVVTSVAARIEGYGADSAPFQALDGAFKRAIGFEADIGIKQVTAAQCPAITFLSRVRSGSELAPRLQIESTSLKSGDVLSGTVGGYGERHVELLLVSDQGIVQNVSSLLKPAPDGMRFDMRVQRSGDVVAQPELLLVVAGPQTLQALQVVNGAMANQVFALALEELRRTGQVIGATVQYFKVGG